VWVESAPSGKIWSAVYEDSDRHRDPLELKKRYRLTDPTVWFVVRNENTEKDVIKIQWTNYLSFQDGYTTPERAKPRRDVVADETRRWLRSVTDPAGAEYDEKVHQEVVSVAVLAECSRIAESSPGTGMETKLYNAVEYRRVSRCKGRTDLTTPSRVCKWVAGWLAQARRTPSQVVWTELESVLGMKGLEAKALRDGKEPRNRPLCEEIAERVVKAGLVDGDLLAGSRNELRRAVGLEPLSERGVRDDRSEQ
jgi:hypothetical protein